MQRNFAPMLNQVNAWKGYDLPDAAAKLMIYRAFIEDDLPAPKHLAKNVHRTTSSPITTSSGPARCGVSRTRLLRPSRNWSRCPRFRATAKLDPFLEGMPNFSVALSCALPALVS
jgi:hypothetical protein